MRQVPAQPSVHRHAEVALAVALAAVLDLFRVPLPHLLYGGSLSLEGVPLLLVALHRGSRTGMLAGVTYGIVSFMIRPLVVHPVQLLLDYPVAFGLLGAGCGLARDPVMRWNSVPRWQQRLRLAAGVVAGNSLRFLAHWVSGVVFFAEYAPPEQPVWLYSLVYNSSYMLPQTVSHILLSQIIIRMLISRQK